MLDTFRIPSSRALPLVLAAAVLAAMFVLAPVASAPASASTGPAVALTSAEADHLGLVNEHRQAKGLAPLVVDARVQADARDWARRLGDAGAVSHDAGIRADCQAASPTCSAWAENVGSASSHRQVFESFLGSPGHEGNIGARSGPGQDPYRVGIGVYRTGGRVFVVQRFVRCDCRNDSLASSMNAARRTDLAFAGALFADFLGRSASIRELDRVAAPLAYGVPRRQAVEGLAFSDDWLGDLIDGYYRETLGRVADAAGKRFWTETVRGGRTPADVAAHFFASDEYHARSGGTDRDWVRAVYRAMLGREADPAGVDHWVSILTHTSRDRVAADFYQSEESRRRRVRGLYDLLLGRAPDGHGLAHWTAELADGHDVRLAIELASSEEYVRRALTRSN